MSDRIHVIDDDDGVRQGLAFLLEAHGLDAQFHASATAFLADVEDRGACIVTDIRMPEMTGLELVKRLRDEGDQTPVVVITGHGDVPLAVQAMKAGVHDFLEKPFSPDTLLSSLRRALDKRHLVLETAACMNRPTTWPGSTPPCSVFPGPCRHCAGKCWTWPRCRSTC